jgi:hypothetical protein
MPVWSRSAARILKATSSLSKVTTARSPDS